jgi:uncharacterized protein YecE (DUF72 family)
MTTAAVIRVGTAGWSYEDWQGVVYPKRPPRGFDRLALIASLFDTNEINSTFYRIPDARMTRDWSRRVAGNPRFTFTAKLFRGFTHERDAGEEQANGVEAAMEPLAADGRLGCVLAQFPMSFHDTPDNRTHLSRTLDRFARFPLAAEFRHASWNNRETLSLLTEHAAAFANIDQPVLPNNLPPTEHVTAPVAYFRFHGRNAAKWFGPETSNVERYNYLYSEAELTPWVERITRTKAKSAFVVLNNHFRGQAVGNALDRRRDDGAGAPGSAQPVRGPPLPPGEGRGEG